MQVFTTIYSLSASIYPASIAGKRDIVPGHCTCTSTNKYQRAYAGKIQNIDLREGGNAFFEGFFIVKDRGKSFGESKQVKGK
jgi:hypothetical protein